MKEIVKIFLIACSLFFVSCNEKWCWSTETHTGFVVDKYIIHNKYGEHIVVFYSYELGRKISIRSTAGHYANSKIGDKKKITISPCTYN